MLQSSSTGPASSASAKDLRKTPVSGRSQLEVLRSVLQHASLRFCVRLPRLLAAAKEALLAKLAQRRLTQLLRVHPLAGVSHLKTRDARMEDHGTIGRRQRARFAFTSASIGSSQTGKHLKARVPKVDIPLHSSEVD